MTPHDQALEAAVVACEMQSDETLVNRHMMPRFVSAYLAALSATHVLVPVEMTEDQARRSMEGHALADRVREVNPAEFERWVRMRRATWGQLVAAMREGAP